MKIRPFRGYRYAGGARDLSAVVAPPYDQISPETQARLYAMHPHNIVRVTRPQDEPAGDRYRRAREVLDGWLAEGVWARDERPSLYAYHQTYRVGGDTITRVALIALGEATDYRERIVLPHERTHAGPKRDRLRLLETTGADVGLLFMLVSDPAGDLLRLMSPGGEPTVEARDLTGERHRLWRIIDEATIARARALLAPRPVIIADGHHRYETAVEYARGHPAARWKLMAFCVLEAPGLTILPNHRLVHDVPGFSLERLAKDAAAWFEAEPLADPLVFRPSNRAIGVVAAGEARVFRLRDDAVATVAWPAGTSPAWRSLAVSILHEGLLRPHLGITDAKLDAKTHVDYTADQVEAVRVARTGTAQAAFLIAPTTPQELEAVLRGGDLLPQKSTHFYPKLLDGLVFHRLEADAEEAAR